MSERHYQRINVSQARSLLQQDNALLLDSRDERAYAQDHIDSAQHLDSRSLDHIIATANRRQPVLIYCYHGNASQVHAQTFADFGFREVYSLDGGYAAWHAAASVQALVSDAAQGSTLLTHWLASQGFNPDLRLLASSVIDNHTTALMRACRLGDTEIVRSLLRHPGVIERINTRNADGNNALWHACFSGSDDCAALIIEAGIDINNRNSAGLSPLMFVALINRLNQIELLLAAGADTELCDHQGRRALDLVISTKGRALLESHAVQGVTT